MDMRSRSLSRALRSVTVRPKGTEGTAMTRNRRDQELGVGEPPEFSEQYLLERLVAAGVGCLDDWRALSPRARHSIFGITANMARAIDRMAKAHPV